MKTETFQQEPTTKKVDKHSQVGIYTKTEYNAQTQ